MLGISFMIAILLHNKLRGTEIPLINNAYKKIYE